MATRRMALGSRPGVVARCPPERRQIRRRQEPALLLRPGRRDPDVGMPEQAEIATDAGRPPDFPSVYPHRGLLERGIDPQPYRPTLAAGQDDGTVGDARDPLGRFELDPRLGQLAIS